MGIMSAAARAAMKAKKAAKSAKKVKKNSTKKVEDIDSLVKEQVAKAKAAKAKREANEKLGQKAKAKTKKKDSGDISEVLMPEDRPSKDTEKQSSKERLINATGSISAMLTKAGPKPLSMDKYRSLPTAARNAFARQANTDYKNNFITKAQYETIIERIEAAELYKNVRSMEQGTANKKAKPVTLDKSMALSEKTTPRKPSDMTKKELTEELRKQEAKAKPRPMKKGGMAKRKNYKDGGYANCGASMKPTQGKK